MTIEQTTISDIPVTKVASEEDLFEAMRAHSDAEEIIWYPVNANLEWFFRVNRDEVNKMIVEVYCHDIGVSGLVRPVSLLLRDKIKEMFPEANVHDFVMDYNEANRRKGLGLFQPGISAPCYTRDEAIKLDSRKHIEETEKANIANKGSSI